MLVEPGAIVGCVELGGLLHKGVHAALYEGRHTRLDLDVMVRISRGAPEEDRERFLRELRVLTQLKHPTVVRAIDFGEYQDLRYLVSLRARGRSLEDYLAQHREPLAERVIVKLLARAARAVHACHALGVAHRNLQPEHLLIDERGHLRIADFGFAPASLEPGREVTGAARERLHYLPPECAAPDAEISASADLFSLGVITYELVFQRLPYPAWLPEDLRSPDTSARAPLDLPTHCSPELIDITGKLIEPRAEARIQRVEDLLALLPRESSERAAPGSVAFKRAVTEPGSTSPGVGRTASSGPEDLASRAIGSGASSSDGVGTERIGSQAVAAASVRADAGSPGSIAAAEHAAVWTPEPPAEFQAIATFLQRRFGSSVSRYADGAVLHTHLRERFLVWASLLGLIGASVLAFVFG